MFALRTVVIAVLCAVFAGCGPSETTTDSTPGPVSIDVMVDGSAAGHIDAAWISAHPSELAWGDGKAWLFSTVFGEAYAQASRLEVTSSGGEIIVFPNPTERPDGLLPVLVLNRKGETIVTLTEPQSSEGGFHGRGGARNRTGDPALRVVGVRRLELTRTPAP